MIKEKVFYVLLSLVVFMAGTASTSLAAVVVGQSLTFDPTAPRPGEAVTPVLQFQVEGGPVNLSLSYVAELSSPHVTFVGRAITGTYPTGTHSVRLSQFTVPDPAPNEICLSVSVQKLGEGGAPQLLFDGVCLRRDIRVASAGRGERRVLPTLTSGTLPDLVIVRPELNTRNPSRYLGAGEVNVQFNIANTGGTAAANVEWKVIINYFRCIERVSPFSLSTSGIPILVARRIGTIPRIAPGESVLINVKISETMMTYIDSGQTQRWVNCDIVGGKIVVDPSNRIREGSEDNTYIFPRSRTPIKE